MNLTIRSAEVAENKYAYTQSAEGQAQSGCIGHLRVDMGWDGKGFFTSWDNHADGLNTPEFRDEFQQVINELRRDMLRDRASLRRYCSSHAEAAMPEANNSFCLPDQYKKKYILVQMKETLVCFMLCRFGNDTKYKRIAVLAVKSKFALPYNLIRYAL